MLNWYRTMIAPLKFGGASSESKRGVVTITMELPANSNFFDFNIKPMIQKISPIMSVWPRPIRSLLTPALNDARTLIKTDRFRTWFLFLVLSTRNELTKHIDNPHRMAIIPICMDLIIFIVAFRGLSMIEKKKKKKKFCVFLLKPCIYIFFLTIMKETTYGSLMAHILYKSMVNFPFLLNGSTAKCNLHAIGWWPFFFIYIYKYFIIIINDLLCLIFVNYVLLCVKFGLKLSNFVIYLLYY